MADLPEKKEKREDDDENVDDAEENKTGSEGGSQPECPICLQACMHPVELPCRHVFCYLCIKGVAMQGPNARCAICRSTIPFSVLTNPQLKDVSQLYKESKSANGYQWYYESRSGGWWQYDERTMQDLERAFASSQPTCQLLLAGHLYVVDFAQMIQYRSGNRGVSRRIKRGINVEKRGVAGIRISGSNTGAGTSGGANNGSSPPPSQSSGPMTRQRRRGNSSAAPGSSQQPTATSGQQTQSSASTPVNSAVGNPGFNNSQSTSSDSPRGHDDHISDSDDEDEDEDYDSDYSDVDDDMELGEEEEGLIGEDSDERETEDEEEYESRDGARAPTRRSDRSNSSNNQTPPPPGTGTGTSMGNGGVSRTYSPNPNNGRGSRGAKSGRSSGGRSSNSNNGTASRSASNALSDSSSTVPSHLSASSPVIGQVNFTVSQSLNNIPNPNVPVKVAFEKRSRHINQEEYL